MDLPIDQLQAECHQTRAGKESSHSAEFRSKPPAWAYDYILLELLSRDMTALVRQASSQAVGKRALDIGAGNGPYDAMLRSHGFALEKLDLEPAPDVQHVGRIEATGLPDEMFDLVVCCQVLEHCDEPWRGMEEIKRVLRPGGLVLFSAPHIWFYHPHPKDHWRFTQEGIIRLCTRAGFAPLTLKSQGGSVAAFFQIANFLLYGLVGKWGAPIYFVANRLGLLLDGLLSNQMFSLNFACLARKH